MTTKIRTFVEYEYPGSFYAESEVFEVQDRDPGDIANRRARPGVFAFSFFDRAESTTTVNGQVVPMTSQPFNRSSRYLIDAELLDAAAVAALPGDHRILLDNMRANGWAQVARCRAGNFQPFNPDTDVVINTRKAQAR